MDWFIRRLLAPLAVVILGALVFSLAGSTRAEEARIPHNEFKGRFRVDSAGLVVDEVRRLIWSRCSYGQVYNGLTCAGRPRVLTQKKARAHCAGLSKNKTRVWRLPALDELQSLSDANRTRGAKIDPRWFPATDPYGYWTGSFFTQTDGLYWSIFHFGEARHFGAREGKYLVRCVTEWFGE